MTRTHLFLATVLVVGNLFAHKPISDLCDRLFVALGRSAYEAVALLAIGAASIGAAFALRGRWSRSGDKPAVLPLLGLAVMTIAAQRWLLVSNVELIHFPQFALLAVLLLAAGIEPRPAWLIATAAGVLDEVYQWRFIYAGVPHTYLDFNDMLLNAMGAAWPVLLWPSPFGSTGSAATEDGTRRSAILSAAVVVLLLYLDPPRFHPFLVQAMTGRAYRVLTAGEALGAGLLVWQMVRAATSPRHRAEPDEASCGPEV